MLRWSGGVCYRLLGMEGLCAFAVLPPPVSLSLVVAIDTHER